MEQHQLAALRSAAQPYLEFLRNANLSVGIYRLAAGAEDNQRPHTEDEVYYVIAGPARFHAGDRDVPVAPGDILFVSALEPHQFHEIREDLELLVFFAPREGSRAASKPA